MSTFRKMIRSFLIGFAALFASSLAHGQHWWQKPIERDVCRTSHQHSLSTIEPDTNQASQYSRLACARRSVNQVEGLAQERSLNRTFLVFVQLASQPFSKAEILERAAFIDFATILVSFPGRLSALTRICLRIFGFFRALYAPNRPRINLLGLLNPRLCIAVHNEMNDGRVTSQEEVKEGFSSDFRPPREGNGIDEPLVVFGTCQGNQW